MLVDKILINIFMNEKLNVAEKSVRSIWNLGDTFNFDTIKGAKTKITVEYEGRSYVVYGELGFRFVGPDEDHYVPRFRGMFSPTSGVSEIQLFLDFTREDILNLEVLPEPEDARFRVTTPLPLL